jgi:hypothetical protein
MHFQRHDADSHFLSSRSHWLFGSPIPPLFRTNLTRDRLAKQFAVVAIETR